MKSRPWIATSAVVLIASAVFGVVRQEVHLNKAPQPHSQSMDGLMTGAKTLSLKALQKSLPPRIRAARRLVIIRDGCACPHCTPFYTMRNDTNLPGILVTNAAPAKDLPAANLTIIGTGTGLLTDEMEAADQGAFLIDFVNRSIVVARGPFSSWTECRDVLHNNTSTYKVKL